MKQTPHLSEKVRCNIASARIILQNDDSVAIREQECHLNIDREANIVHVCCSHSNYITKLKKNPHFNVRLIYVNKEGRILQLLGEMPTNLITIRGCRGGSDE